MHLKRGLDEYGLEIIGIELCALSSQVVADHAEDFEEDSENREGENQNYQTTFLKGNKLYFPNDHGMEVDSEKQGDTLLKDYLLKKYNVQQREEEKGNTVKEDHRKQIPQPFNTTKTFLIFEEQYLTRSTYEKPFNYKLLDKVREMTNEKSLLHMKNSRIAQIFYSYFHNYFVLENIKKITQEFLPPHRQQI